MGGLFSSPSSLSVDVVASVINESILKLSSEVKTNNVVTQYMEATEGSVIENTQQYANVTSNVTSVIQATQQDDFNSQLATTVSQDLSKKTVALLGALDSLLQDNNMNLATSVSSKVQNMNIMELAPVCALNDTITQTLIAQPHSRISGSSQVIKADFIQNCTTLVDSNMTTVSDITNSVNQRASFQQENPLDFLADMFKHGMTVFVLIIIVIIMGFIVLIGPGKLDANKLIGQAMQIGSTAAVATVNPMAAMSIAPATATNLAPTAVTRV